MRKVKQNQKKIEDKWEGIKKIFKKKLMEKLIRKERKNNKKKE